MLDGGGNSVEHLTLFISDQGEMHFLQHVLLQNRTNFICGISMQNQMLRFFKIAPSKLSLIILIQKSKTPNRVILFCLYMNSIIISSVKTHRKIGSTWGEILLVSPRATSFSEERGWEGVILLTVMASVVYEWVNKSTKKPAGRIDDHDSNPFFRM